MLASSIRNIRLMRRPVTGRIARRRRDHEQPHGIQAEYRKESWPAMAALAAPIVVGMMNPPAIRAQSAQSTAAAARPAFDAFEVATIKPTPPDWRGGRFIRMQAAQQFVARNPPGNTRARTKK